MNCLACRSLQYRYFSETDTLSIFFVKAAPGLIDSTDDALPGLLVDYTDKEELVSVDIRMASRHTRAHFWDTAADVQDAPPLCLQTKYVAEEDSLTVSLVDNPQHCKAVPTDDDRIVVWVDGAGKWESIAISKALTSIVH